MDTKFLRNGFRKLVLLFLLTLILFSFIKGWNNFLTIEWIGKNYTLLQSSVQEHFILALMIYMFLYVVIVFLCLPLSLVATLSGGLLFGWKIGATSAIFSATLGATLLFEVAKTSLGSLFLENITPWLAKLRDGFNKNAFSYLLFLRLVPLFPFFVINLVPAFLNVPLKTFISATFLGILPATFAYSYAGSSLASVVEAQNLGYATCLARQKIEKELECPYVLDTNHLLTPEVLYALVFLGCVALLPVVLKRRERSY